MSDFIKVKRGFNIRIEGEAKRSVKNSLSQITKVAVKPSDFKYLSPKLLVKEGSEVKAGTALFFDENNEKIVITSPVSGIVKNIVHGDENSIEAIEIEVSTQQDYEKFDIPELKNASKEEVTNLLLKSGTWAFIRQRPFNKIANPDDNPKYILISAFDTAPIAPDYDLIMRGKKEHLQIGIDVLKKISNKIYLTKHETLTVSNVFDFVRNVDTITFSGKHPAGNVGVQMHHINPINKGDVVWHINPQDVATIGSLFANGVYDSSKIIALAGSEVISNGYHKIYGAACIENLIHKNIVADTNPRYISGNVLTGKSISENGFLGFYDNLICIIPEGDKRERLGWLLPGFKKFSFWTSFFSWLNFDGEYKLDTNLHGGKNAFIFSDKFRKVLPMKIMPIQLLKACLAKDVEAMEALGIYEVDAEDFALCEFIDPSKQEIQEIIDQGLELIRKEC